MQTNIGLTSGNEASDTSFGPYFIRCNGDQISAFQMENGLSGLNSIILVFRVHSIINPVQTILSFQTSTSIIYKIQYSSVDNNLIFINGANSISTTPNTIIQGEIYCNFMKVIMNL